MKRALIALALAAALPMSAQASELSYSYFGANWTQLNSEGSADNENTWQVYGSLDLGDTGFYLHATHQFESDIPHYGHTDSDEAGFTVGGIGWHHPISDNVDFLAEASYGEDNDNGGQTIYRLGVGLRGSFNENWEGSLRVANYDTEFDGNGLMVNAGVQYKFDDNWGATFDAQFGSHAPDGETYDTAWSLGLRASF
jgi:opacity protein-like surface antigen